MKAHPWIIATLLACPLPAPADHPKHSVESANYSVVLDVVESSRNEMHQGMHRHGRFKKIDHDLYHVQATVYDKTSGLLVTDARLYATVYQVDTYVQRKHLARETIDDRTAYCEYIYLHTGESYRIRLDIHHPGRPASETVHVNYGKALYGAN